MTTGTEARLMIVGGGRMGEALLGGLLAADWADAAELVVVEPAPDRATALRATWPGIVVTDAPVAADGAILAVKPKLAPTVARSVGALAVPRIMSIAAGVSTATLESELPDTCAVIRAMPNTPALVRSGAGAIAAGRHADAADLDWAEGILGTVGTVARVDEAHLDAVTGLSGSGPAYVFLFVEAMIEAGVLNGLDRATATTLTVQTVRGAAALLDRDDAEAPALRAAVTSPGGTTAAGLAALEHAGMRAAVLDAVTAATRRSRELG